MTPDRNSNEKTQFNPHYKSLQSHLPFHSAVLLTRFFRPESTDTNFRKPTLTKRKRPQLNSFACSVFFFSKAPSLSVHVYIRSGGWHTDLSLGWRPVAGAALAARSWETGGRHPNVITAAKLLSIEAKLQKYVPRGLPTMKTEAHLSGCCSGSCPALCFVGFTMSKKLQIPQLLADITVQRRWLCGNSHCFSLIIIVPCYCAWSLVPKECTVHIVYERITLIAMFWITVARLSWSPECFVWIREADTLSAFKISLKTFLFGRTYRIVRPDPPLVTLQYV